MTEAPHRAKMMLKSAPSVEEHVLANSSFHGHLRTFQNIKVFECLVQVLHGVWTMSEKTKHHEGEKGLPHSHNIFFPCVSVGACSAVWALVGVLFFLNVVVAAVWYLNKSRQLQRYFKHTHTQTQFDRSLKNCVNCLVISLKIPNCICRKVQH